MVPARTYVREALSYMEISWLGHACFQLRGKNATLITDPFSPQSGELLQLSKISPSIVTLSHTPPGLPTTLAVGGTPYIVRGPGEYEISDVLITGIADYHDDKNGQQRRRNTIYVIHIDELVVCHLGVLSQALQENQLEEVADADVLLMPIGDYHTITATQAAELISQVEPRIVIPIYSPAPTDNTGGSGTGRDASDVLSKFCREMGMQAINMQPKINVTRTNIATETQVVLLSPR